MKRIIISALVAMFISNTAFATAVFDLKSSQNSHIAITKEIPELYKPTRLIIGEENKIKIKAEPGSNIKLITSFQDSGAQSFYGQDLRVGSSYKIIAQTVPENGIAELMLSIDDKELIGKPLYIEALMWKKDDYSDLAKANIIGANGQETKSNSIVIYPKPQKPGAIGIVPGTAATQQLFDSYKYMSNEEDKEQLINVYDVEYDSNTPAIIRNMDAAIEDQD